MTVRKDWNTCKKKVLLAASLTKCARRKIKTLHSWNYVNGFFGKNQTKNLNEYDGDDDSVGVVDRVTGIGKKCILSLAIFVVLLSFCQNVEPNLGQALRYCANFYCCKWLNIEKISSNLVTLVVVSATILNCFWWAIYEVSNKWSKAVVTAQLLERLLSTSEDPRLIPVTSN